MGMQTVAHAPSSLTLCVHIVVQKSRRTRFGKFLSLRFFFFIPTYVLRVEKQISRILNRENYQLKSVKYIHFTPAGESASACLITFGRKSSSLKYFHMLLCLPPQIFTLRAIELIAWKRPLSKHT